MSKLGSRLIKAAREGRAAIKETREFLKLYEKFTEKQWGPRCKKFSSGCPRCQAWQRYDQEYEAHK